MATLRDTPEPCSGEAHSKPGRIPKNQPSGEGASGREKLLVYRHGVIDEFTTVIAIDTFYGGRGSFSKYLKRPGELRYGPY
jgi:hypothetical protein